MARQPEDLTDEAKYPPGRFGYLRPLAPQAARHAKSVVWDCLCDPARGGCGRTCVTTSRRLVHNQVRSCGCHPRGKAPTTLRRVTAAALAAPGVTVAALAAAEGVSTQTAHEALRRAGLIVRGRGRPRKHKTPGEGGQ